GGTWDVLDDFVLSNYMPNLKRLRETGASGVLSSTVPAITPAAWTSSTSGCSPHIHGLMDFRYYNFADNILKLARSDRVKVPSMWYYLGQAGYKTASLNVPFTFPVYPINGVMVSGLGCPGTSAEFTYPSDFKDKILAKMPDYGLGLGPEVIDKRSGGLGRNKEEFLANLKSIERRMAQRVELVELVQGHEPMDILMVQFQEVDLIEHLGWPYVSAKTRDQYPWYRDKLFETFARLDEHIGKLVERIDLQKDLLVM
ncbi:MAG: hypothetical protein GY869_21255, partial [Planctomycetes bacterium]|nr:hypothetical protein [Planctomycetota bacterium]